ncbi:MAG: hypothetical protein KDE14_12300, partial [Rhodobacteraceae bacterium]|nr:hypothetical protein [Paracoccaceae bacterium]
MAKRSNVREVLLAVILATGGISGLPAFAQVNNDPVVIEGPGGPWKIESANRAGDVRVAQVLGRDAMMLRAGTHVVFAGGGLEDGEMTFDLAPLDDGDFVGVMFHRESFRNHENLYLRLSRSGEFMALQYAPRTNGSSTWQLYPQFTAKTAWPRNQWTTVRIAIDGAQLSVFIGNKS